ncbi:MAG TPA: acetylglutamate kinase [Elusimicrobiota bacterium]|jgi:acetylglutamate kinase|nr:acetylglutamate kinase [Elusimicrobiota bacterium]
MIDPHITLKQAVPYLRLYKGKIFVVKAGGAVLEKNGCLAALAEDVATLEQLGVKLVVVHGGGPQASRLQRQMGLEPRIVAGRRVTDAQTLEAVKMAYRGTINLDVVGAMLKAGCKAVGLCGLDGGLVKARKRPPVHVAPAPGQEPVEVDYGFVGDVESVDPKVLTELLDGGFTPVVAPLAGDAQGGALNMNADTLASAIARALGAEKLIVLTDVDGVLRDVANPASLVSYTDAEEVAAMTSSGKLGGGMLPKVEACTAALKGGVKRTHIINGTRRSALLSEVFTNSGCGTMIVERKEREAYQQAELAAAA